MRILDQSGVSHTKSALSKQPQGFHRGLLRTLLLADDNLPRRVASTRTIIPLTFSDTAFSRARQAGEKAVSEKVSGIIVRVLATLRGKLSSAKSKVRRRPLWKPCGCLDSALFVCDTPLWSKIRMLDSKRRHPSELARNESVCC